MCLMISLTLFGQQHHVCGLHDHEILIERLLANKAYLNEIGIQNRDGVSYVPVKYHIIGKTDGSSRQSPKKVLDMHCALNEFYAEGDEGIQFYIKDGFNYIDNSTAYDNHASVGGTFQLTNNRVSNAVNIYIPKDATPPNGSGIGVTLGYYSPSNDWIVIRKADANGSSLTAPHELGHFFSVAHPFNGWDSTPWDGSMTQAPATSPSGVPTEKVDGSNCETAGDFVCDTPPSYLFFNTGGCNYNGGALDPCGVAVDPDEYNIMDYFDDSCAPKYFTPGQKELINADYDQRVALHTNWTPNSLTVDGPPAIVQPADDATTSGFDHVIFEWDPVAGADRYLLEVDRLSDFSLNPWIQVVYGTHKDLWGIFEANKSYHWRVTPFNPYNTCAASTAVNKFTTGNSTSTLNISGVSNWSINPNPVSQNNMMITMETITAFDGEVAIVSTTGQTLQTKLHHFTAGNNTLEMSVENIPNGMYMVNIKTNDQLINKKIVVAK